PTLFSASPKKGDCVRRQRSAPRPRRTSSPRDHQSPRRQCRGTGNSGTRENLVPLRNGETLPWHHLYLLNLASHGLVPSGGRRGRSVTQEHCGPEESQPASGTPIWPARRRSADIPAAREKSSLAIGTPRAGQHQRPPSSTSVFIVIRNIASAVGAERPAASAERARNRPCLPSTTIRADCPGPIWQALPIHLRRCCRLSSQSRWRCLSLHALRPWPVRKYSGPCLRPRAHAPPLACPHLR